MRIINDDERISIIQKLALFHGETKHSLSRLSAHLDNCHELTFQPGENLFKIGEPAQVIYYIQSGKAYIPETGQILKEGDLFSREALLHNAQHFHSACAQTPVQVISLDKNNLKEIALQNDQIKNNICNLLIGQNPKSVKSETQSIKSETKADLWILIGWLSTLLSPILIFFFTQDINEDQKYFLMIFSSTLCMWIFNILPEYMGAIFIVVASLLLGLAPVEVILGGYSSSSLFMALSVFALGSVIVQSGLIYRISMLLIYYLPPRIIFYEIILNLLGIFLTPLLPSANGRVALLTPLLIEIIETVGYKKGGAAASRLSIAVFSGLSLYSASFLTSKSVNFAVFGLLPEQVAEQFTWGFWFFASSVSFVVLFILTAIFTTFFFRTEKEKISKQREIEIKRIIKLQLNILGRLTFGEWTAIIFIFIFILGLMTSSIHKIQPSWIGLGILFGLLSLGSFTTKDFRIQIDWPFLFMLAGLIGMVQVMSVLGIEKWISKNLLWVGVLMGESFSLFVLVLAVVTFILRFILPNNASIILLSSLYIPASIISGINPWIVVFIILLLSDTWFMSYQCSYYLAFNELTDPKELYNKKQFIIFNLLTTVFRIIAIYASIPFWHIIGLF